MKGDNLLKQMIKFYNGYSSLTISQTTKFILQTEGVLQTTILNLTKIAQNSENV